MISLFFVPGECHRLFAYIIRRYGSRFEKRTRTPRRVISPTASFTRTIRGRLPQSTSHSSQQLRRRASSDDGKLSVTGSANRHNRVCTSQPVSAIHKTYYFH